MEDIKVGEYVRTKKGYIAQITEIDKIDKYIWFNNKINKESGIPLYGLSKVEFENLVTKHSKNITDLIEENDFVEIEYYSNRYKERVSRIFEVDFINKNRDVCFENGHCRLNMFYGEWSNQDKLLNPIIKSIVTKEQFNSIKYEV